MARPSLRQLLLCGAATAALLALAKPAAAEKLATEPLQLAQAQTEDLSQGLPAPRTQTRARSHTNPANGNVRNRSVTRSVDDGSRTRSLSQTVTDPSGKVVRSRDVTATKEADGVDVDRTRTVVNPKTGVSRIKTVDRDANSDGSVTLTKTQTRVAPDGTVLGERTETATRPQVSERPAKLERTRKHERLHRPERPGRH